MDYYVDSSLKEKLISQQGTRWGTVPSQAYVSSQYLQLLLLETQFSIRKASVFPSVQHERKRKKFKGLSKSKMVLWEA